MVSAFILHFAAGADQPVLWLVPAMGTPGRIAP